MALPIRPRHRWAVLPVAAISTLAVGLGTPMPVSASSPTPSFQGEDGHLADLDNRKGRVEPTTAQRDRVAALGATARWNEFGTPVSLINYSGSLATGLSSDAATAARQFISANRELFRLSEDGVADLELLNVSPLGDTGGAVVLFRQRFGDLLSAQDGMITVGVKGGTVQYASSSSAGDGSAPAAATVSATQAWLTAAGDVGITLDTSAVTGVSTKDDWTMLTVDGYAHPQRARLRALPTPTDGVKAVWETVVLDSDAGEHPTAYVHYVDARTGAVLFRQSRVNYLEEPEWTVFPANPPLDGSSTDTRQLWCWGTSDPNCERDVSNTAARAPWDVDPRTGVTTTTTKGNAASSGEAWLSPFTPAEQYRPISPTRSYTFPWTNQWFESKCDPAALASTARNDIDAATVNLFAMHNRMHDWSYRLGFTEQNYNMQDSNFGNTDNGPFPVGREADPEIGNVQAGALTGGQPSFLGRDNANQITLQDGIPGITNMYLWQPIAAAFYPPCVDGDYDMSVIGHEYTHAISNRMVGGPDANLTGPQAGAMGESYSDLTAVEYLNEYGFVPTGGENPFSVGAYVTGDKQAGIRNYGMNVSPLNYSNVGYDFTGPQVHADGEIWSATNFRIRSAFNAKYDATYPSSDATLQQRCADGELPADACPGNRRWMQVVFDAYLLMQPRVSFLDARDAYLAADKLRFGGANQALLWNTFASRGMGENAVSNTNADHEPVPSFESPHANEATVTFSGAAAVKGGPKPTDVKVFLGHYEARSVPVADTITATSTGASVRLVPGTYEFLAQAPGFGLVRFTKTVKAGQSLSVSIPMAENVASSARGATATGDGRNVAKLIDDTEATNWASLGSSGTASPARSVEGRKVTVDLAGGARTFSKVAVSAMLRPTDSADAGGDTGSQSRFSALRSFRIEACNAAAGADCSSDAAYKAVYTSPADAFPSVAPRPRAPELIARTFSVPSTTATHVRLVTLTNQCTGGPAFQGDQDNDPGNNSDCKSTAQAENVRAAELQVFATS